MMCNVHFIRWILNLSLIEVDDAYKFLHYNLWPNKVKLHSSYI